MKYVAEYFQELEVRQGYPVETKRVYVATDEPKVLAECRRKFPEYTFLGDVSISKSASVSNRYNANSLRGIIVDIYMLSLTDYIVGTFSSQVRLSVDSSRLDSIKFRVDRLIFAILAGIEDRLRDHADEVPGRRRPLQEPGRHLVLWRAGRAPAGMDSSV